MATVSHHCISQTKFSQAMLWEFSVKLLSHWAITFIVLTIMILWEQHDLWVIVYSANEVIGVPIILVTIVRSLNDDCVPTELGSFTPVFLLM